MIIRINPTFRLRGIDPAQIYREYLAGASSHITQPPSSVKIMADEPLVAPSYGTDAHAPIYQVRDRGNRAIIMATSNHRNFEVYHKTGQFPLGGRCEWCRQDFKHEGNGMVVAYRLDHLLLCDHEGKSSLERTHNFWTEGTMCDHECALAQAELLAAIVPNLRDPIYLDAPSSVKLLYSLMYPDEPELIAAQDYRLIAENGGSIPYAQFKKGRHIWKRSSNLLIIPAKVSYQQLR